MVPRVALFKMVSRCRAQSSHQQSQPGARRGCPRMRRVHTSDEREALVPRGLRRTYVLALVLAQLEGTPMEVPARLLAHNRLVPAKRITKISADGAYVNTLQVVRGSLCIGP